MVFKSLIYMKMCMCLFVCFVHHASFCFLFHKFVGVQVFFQRLFFFIIVRVLGRQGNEKLFLQYVKSKYVVGQSFLSIKSSFKDLQYSLALICNQLVCFFLVKQQLSELQSCLQHRHLCLTIKVSILTYYLTC